MPADINNRQPIRRIGVFGHVGNENLGDEAIIAAVIQNIRLRYPEAQIYGFTINPNDTKERHKIKAFPIRWIDKLEHCRPDVLANENSDRPSKLAQKLKAKLRAVPVAYAFLSAMRKSGRVLVDGIREVRFLIQSYRNLKGMDLLIIAGSQQLIDYVGGPWAFPYTLFKWALLAKAVKTRVAFVSVGAGPIESRLGKFFARNSLALASYRSYRDEASRAFVGTLGVFGPSAVFPDLVYSLQIDTPSARGFDRSLPIVGINAVPFSDGLYWLGANARQYERYVGELADFALWVIERGYQVLFFPTQLRADPPVINDIKNLMKVKADRDVSQKIVDRPIYSFDDLISVISMTDIVVATRFHGIIIPYVLNTPVLGIAYQRKTIELMGQMGQSAYVVDIHSFSADCLKARFVLLESKASIIKDEIKQRKFAFGRALQNQYDQVLSLISGESQGISAQAVQPIISAPF